MVGLSGRNFVFDAFAGYTNSSKSDRSISETIFFSSPTGLDEAITFVF